MEYWIWLSFIEKNNYIEIQSLLKKYKTPERIWNLEEKELLEQGLNLKSIANILNPSYRNELGKYIEYMEKNKIEIITLENNNYPQNLKNIYDYPSVIYLKGNSKILNQTSIAIVGCRKSSIYGEKISKELSYSLSKKGIIIISGLARGIDTFSHMGCLQAQGKTIAVLGSGLDIIYPSENKYLVENIIKNNGAIISEYIVGTTPTKYTFPARNRIISGMSDGVVIVEAKKRSGSLITVDFAIQQGKNVYAIPGNINNLNSEGTNELIKQGAKPLTNLQDILEDIIE